MPIISGGGGGGGTPFNGGTITAPLEIDNTNGAQVPLTIKGAAAQTNDLLDVGNSAGNDVLEVFLAGVNVHSRAPSANHVLEVQTNNGSIGLDIQGDGSGGLGDAFLSAGASSNLTLDSNVTTVDGNYVILGTATQTLTYVNGVAFVISGQNAAPADGDLAAGDIALWFDKTNGAAKLMVKAKQADGAVKTAAVALA